ncbi:Ribosomal RNA small subunit methyltransferase F [bioreactor metagenome]|uniref:Ribosomal RNA small subunit methyltransferase F n=1 Tax=bioreactor metagenome TaxID=1076179 RepID=A0A645ID76_9ZZZZ
MVDAPCSGLGIIAKKPDIKLKNEKEIELLPSLQYAILRNAAEYLKPGGELVYSTCTLKKAENEEIVEKLIRENENYELCDIGSLLPARYLNPGQKGMITLMPHTHNTEGFFISKLRRKF